jgi:hypothetical protein
MTLRAHVASGSSLLIVALLIGALAGTAVADPQLAGAKKCFKKKAGKRVRVKCPKKKSKPKPAKPAPAPTPAAPVPMTDPVAIGSLRAAVAGQMLHRFATSAFAGDEKLYLCSDGSYAYLATLGPELSGLAGLGKTFERGTWLITGADFSADRTRLDGGLLLAPDDRTSVHLVRLAAQAGSDGVLAFLNDTQWYLSANGLCAPA